MLSPSRTYEHYPCCFESMDFFSYGVCCTQTSVHDFKYPFEDSCLVLIFLAYATTSIALELNMLHFNWYRLLRAGSALPLNLQLVEFQKSFACILELHTHILGLYVRNSSFLIGWIGPFYVLSWPLFDQSKIYSINQELNISIDRQAIKSCRKAKTWKLKCRTFLVDLDLKNILLRLIQNNFWL